MTAVRVAMDVSAVMDLPLTGVGQRSLRLTRALLAMRDRGLDIRLFAARARNTPASAFPFEEGFTRKTVLPFCRRLKTIFWSRWNWPPIEWACGDVDIAHGKFHDLPATRKALRIATIHDLSFLLHPEVHTAETIRVQTALVRNCARHADALVAVSENCKRELVDVLGVNPSRIYVVPGGVDLAEFGAAPVGEELHAIRARLGLDGPFFIHLGTIEPRKNLVRLLEAYAILRDEGGALPKLLLAGRAGWMSQPVFDAITRLRLSDKVCHAGYLDRREALGLLTAATACLYPSIYEGFGLPVLEAMAAGTPVLASTAAALMEVSGGTCLHTPPDCVEAIADGVRLLLTQPDAAQERALAARRRAEGMTWDASARTLASVYHSM